MSTKIRTDIFIVTAMFISVNSSISFLNLNFSLNNDISKHPIKDCKVQSHSPHQPQWLHRPHLTHVWWLSGSLGVQLNLITKKNESQTGATETLHSTPLCWYYVKTKTSINDFLQSANTKLQVYTCGEGAPSYVYKSVVTSHLGSWVCCEMLPVGLKIWDESFLRGRTIFPLLRLIRPGRTGDLLPASFSLWNNDEPLTPHHFPVGCVRCWNVSGNKCHTVK